MQFFKIGPWAISMDIWFLDTYRMTVDLYLHNVNTI